MDKLLEILLLIIFAPVLMCAILQFFCAMTQMSVTMLSIAMPWFVLLVLVAALGAGIGAGLTLRHRLPPRPSEELPPPPGTALPVRRAPQIPHDEDEE